MEKGGGEELGRRKKERVEKRWEEVRMEGKGKGWWRKDGNDPTTADECTYADGCPNNHPGNRQMSRQPPRQQTDV